MKIEIKSIYGDVLFSYDHPENSVSKTLVEAIRNRATLSGADLRSANLRSAYLSGADLSGAYLSGADLRSANLSGANLSDAYLSGAYLSGADLRSANLSGAYLSGANLRSADLRSAYLSGADLRSAKNVDLIIAQTRILPEGDIFGYKKCRNSVIVKLLIKKEHKRSSAFGRKCRAEAATVVEIFGADVAYSTHDNTFSYQKGQEVRPVEPFSENWQSECESGIHFFITREEAENYF